MCIFTESGHWADSVSKLWFPSVCLFVSDFFSSSHLITHIYKGQKSSWWIAKRFQYIGNRDKLRANISLKFSNFCSEMVENCRTTFLSVPRGLIGQLNWSAAGAGVQSDDSGYLNLALSLIIRSKDLTTKDIFFSQFFSNEN